MDFRGGLPLIIIGFLTLPFQSRMQENAGKRREQYDESLRLQYEQMLVTGPTLYACDREKIVFAPDMEGGLTEAALYLLNRRVAPDLLLRFLQNSRL